MTKVAHENTWSINTKLGTAFLFGFLGWVIWPQSIAWWAFGFCSIVLWIVALGQAIKAVREMVQVRHKLRETYAFKAKGRDPEQARLADALDLKKAGLIDE